MVGYTWKQSSIADLEWTGEVDLGRPRILIPVVRAGPGDSVEVLDESIRGSGSKD